MAIAVVFAECVIQTVTKIEGAVFTKARIDHAVKTAQKTVYQSAHTAAGDVSDNGFARGFTCLLKDLNSRCTLA